ACQPSKKFGSTSTQRRYFSTALSSSPTARSPFASSKMSSRVGISAIGVQRGSALRFRFGHLNARVALPITKPFVENDRAIPRRDIFFKLGSGFLILRGIGRVAFLHQNDESAIAPGNKIARFARLKLGRDIFNHHRVGRFVLWFVRRIFCVAIIRDDK